MWELDYREAERRRIDAFELQVLEKTLESPLDCKEIQSVNPKRNQSWIFIGRTDDEVETPVLWPPDAKNRLIGKDPDAGKHWRQEEKGMTEDEMIEWHHWHDGWVWVGSESWWWTEKPGVLQSKGVARSWTWLSDWTELRGQELWGRVSFIPFVNSAYAVSHTYASHSPGNLGMYWHLCLSGNGNRESPNGLLHKYQFHIVQKTKRTKNQPQSQNPEIVESTKSYIVESTKS